jgi:hypothetical protein
MAQQHVTLTLRGMDPNLVGSVGYVQVDGGPKVRISAEDLGNLFVMAETIAGEDLIMTPVPGSGGEEESIRVPLRYPLQTYLPPTCFAALTPSGPQAIPGQIGALCMTVGGAEALATMLGVTVSDLTDWARDGVPDGPARILIVRLGEDYGLNLSHIPTRTQFLSATAGGL